MCECVFSVLLQRERERQGEREGEGRGGGGGIGSNSFTLASLAAAQSCAGCPVRHGNAVIKPAWRGVANQSTHASGGLYLETREEHFTISSCRAEGEFISAGLLLVF